MARFLAYVPEAFESIYRNGTRSLLSILGMVIGIASVIGVLGLSQAASNGIKLQLAQGGDPGFFVFPDESQNDPSIATLYYRDVAQLTSYAAGAVDHAVPLYFGRLYRVTVSKHTDYIGVSSTKGLSSDDGLVLTSGRFIDAEDVVSGANVCMMSQSAVENLFPNGGALGQSINVGTERVTIAGTFSVTGSLFNSSVGDAIYVPYTTMHRIAPGPIDYIQFWRSSGTGGVDAIDAVRAALARIHPRAVYTVQDQSATLGVFEGVVNAIGIGLTFIGGIALFVAGVGIMNIMLVSVTERTREIGIRKSIGANAGDIALQFLIEAALLSLAGGALGTALGVAIVWFGRGIILQSVGAAPVPWAGVIAIAVGFSLAVGIAFGWYPAGRAGRLDPVEALRS
jgi:putative ABC transport system permease protein